MSLALLRPGKANSEGTYWAGGVVEASRIKLVVLETNKPQNPVTTRVVDLLIQVACCHFVHKEFACISLLFF